MGSTPRGRLELTWMGKDQALIPTNEGTYDYTWVNRDDPRACQTHYLVDEGHVGDRSDGGIHDNLLITGESGDVLEVLTREPSLAEKYVGRVKCVYIDPPFNTEKIFTQYDDNLEHSVWLTMMRDRLVLLKKMLTQDGSIWVHLDSSENHRMRLLLDEIFGADSFVATIVWQKRYSRESRPAIGEVHDSIHVYSLGADSWKTTRNKLARTSAKEYKNANNDPRGPWRIVPMTAPGVRLNQQYEIVGPDGTVHLPPRGRCWSTIESGYWELVAQDRIRFGMTGKGAPGILRYLNEEDEGLTPWTWWPHEEVGHTDESKKEIQALFPGQPAFDTPKPERLLERIIHIATDPGDIVLDCFAGSGTTAAVAHKMGRRWVTCELLPETVAKFTHPRLEKVVAGRDPGGITARAEFEAVNGLPGLTTVDEARTFTTVLGRVLKSVGEDDGQDDDSLETDDEVDLSKLDPQAIAQLKDAAKVLRAATKTRKVTHTQWKGGGGFDVARLSPEWVGVRADTVSGVPDAYLLPQATGEVLARSVAAHLGFRWLPETPRFAGRKGRQWLAVVEGMFTDALLDEFLADIPDGDSLTVCCFGAADGMDRRLRRCAKGSRLLVMPDDLFALRRWEA